MSSVREFDFEAGTRFFVTGGVDVWHVHDHEADPAPERGRLGCAYRVPRVGREYRTFRAAANAAGRLENGTPRKGDR